ncbi:MAG: acyltransferase [Gemmatimonadaceae bacterium]|nr:acyltransferase [Gemmatimonadaceae bacterium]
MLVVNPRAAVGRFKRYLGVLRARHVLRGCRCGALVVALGDIDVRAEGEIRVGDRVQLAAGMFATSLHCGPGATLDIGALTFLSYGVSIRAKHHVQVGRRCQIASMVLIRDENELSAGPVRIGDDVWLAYGVIVEPGVTIGEGSVVSAGSVVRDDVPPFSLAQGNPATWVPLRDRRTGDAS